MADREVTDLRSYLAVLEEAGELARIKAPLSLDQEIGAVCYRNLRNRGPGLLFEHPGGSNVPLAVDLLASRRRYALALGVETDQLAATWNERAANPLPPVIVKKGACQEHVMIGDDVDLTKFPVPIWNDLDGGPYLTLCGHLSKDPDTGTRNVGLYRNQVHDRNTLGILSGPYTHLTLQRRKAPGKPFPVALILGADPTVVITATSPLPFGTDELAVAGALRGKPMELVPCRTIPLEVPVTAQIVIEGEIDPEEQREEGPFGEFTGYYGGPKMRRDVIHVKAITHQENPILQLTYEGMPPHESSVLTGVPRDAEILRTVKLPGLKSVYVTDAAGGAFHAVVSVEKTFEGFGKYVGLAVLGTQAGRYIKQVIVVDDDIDPFDPVAVEWAVATRVQAHRDIEILNEVTGVFLDPSMDHDEQRGPSRVSKWIIDATRYNAKDYPLVCEPKVEVMEKVAREWIRYGIHDGR